MLQSVTIVFTFLTASSLLKSTVFKLCIKRSTHDVIGIQSLNHRVTVSLDLIRSSGLLAPSVETGLVLPPDNLPRARPQKGGKTTHGIIWMGHCHCVVVQVAVRGHVKHSAIIGFSNDRNIPKLTCR
jgi:hypothetical protein